MWKGSYALGLIAAGLAEMAGGVTGEIVGGMLSATGVGAVLGVPPMAVSTAVVAGVVGLMSNGRGLVRSHLRVRQSHRPRETVRRDHGHQSER